MLLVSESTRNLQDKLLIPGHFSGNTIPDDDEFWSSTASGPQQEEHLLYRLNSPHSSVYCVQVAVYRARYQLGCVAMQHTAQSCISATSNLLMLCRAPLYPPNSISFEVGFSLNHTQPIPGRYQVRHTDQMQTYQLPASTSIGHFFKINLHGKAQQQFEDRQYYTALRCVKIIGRCLSAAAVYDTSQLVRSGQLPLTQILNMPATLCQQLQNMTVHSRYNYTSVCCCTWILVPAPSVATLADLCQDRVPCAEWHTPESILCSHPTNCRDASETAAVAEPGNSIARVHAGPDVGEDSFPGRNAELPMQSKTAIVADLCSTETDTFCKHFLDCSNTSGVVFCDSTHSL